MGSIGSCQQRKIHAGRGVYSVLKHAIKHGNLGLLRIAIARCLKHLCTTTGKVCIGRDIPDCSLVNRIFRRHVELQSLDITLVGGLALE